MLDPLSRDPRSTSVQDLLGLALALGADQVPGLSSQEEILLRSAASPAASLVYEARARIEAGHDPLGDLFCYLRSPVERRPLGATYTPPSVIESMTRWAASQQTPSQVVDPGTGSGRFLVRAGKEFRRAKLVGIEVDPISALLARANIAANGMARRSKVLLGDYREISIPRNQGRTLFLGNPPYVRHHQIDQRWKAWLTATAASLGLESSQLAGLHVHFYLATAKHGQPGDIGAFITSAEWLDVNYGRLVRELLLSRLGGLSITVIEPTVAIFADAATTSAITCFQIGAAPTSIRLKRVDAAESLGALDGGRPVRRERLEVAARWTPLTRGSKRGPQGYVELGELARVHRGQVTGANRVWIEGPHCADLPESVMFPSITKARELFNAGLVLDDPALLKRVIDLPVDLDILESEERERVLSFLKRARLLGADEGYVARTRRAWWAVGLREPAPILATYMARRPPAFVRNIANARHLNIAHGLYPREKMSDQALLALATFLSKGVTLAQGRMYAGGLTKFEPREMERILVPGPEILLEMARRSFTA